MGAGVGVGMVAGVGAVRCGAVRSLFFLFKKTLYYEIENNIQILII